MNGDPIEEWHIAVAAVGREVVAATRPLAEWFLARPLAVVALLILATATLAIGVIWPT